MKLKNDDRLPSRYRNFYYEGKDAKGKTRTYKVGPANSIEQLVVWSTRQMENQGVEVPPNLQEIIEHQICVRFSKPSEYCWNSGIGDEIHNQWAVPFLDRMATLTSSLGVVGQVVAKAVQKIKGCQSCGGTRTYKQGANNLGRAGSLNKLSKK